MCRTAVAALLLLVSVGAAADVRYRVLVPLYFYQQPVPGALGSMWITQLAIHNAGPVEFRIQTCAPPREDVVCLRILSEEASIDPGETQTLLPQFDYPLDPNVPGRVLHMITPHTADTLSYQLRIADTSRSALNAGTEVPVVRERDFRIATTQLLNIPVDPRFRLTFRLYEMNLSDASFTIRVFDQSSGALLGSRDVRAVIRTPQVRIVVEPGYVQLNDLSALIPASTAPSSLRLELEPRTVGSAFWAFVSITNNDTQQFTLVTPQ